MRWIYVALMCMLLVSLTLATPDLLIIDIPPAADFEANITQGPAPLVVQFNDSSYGNVTSYEWDFNDDGSPDSTLKDPVYSYVNPGTFTVRLLVAGPGGIDSEVKINYILVTEGPGIPFLSIPGMAVFLVILGIMAFWFGKRGGGN